MINKIDRATGRMMVMIFAGELYVTKAEELVMTTVGGCVSVCIFAGVRCGLNHYMLPQPNKVDTGKSGSYLYGVNAIITLIHDLEKTGCRRNQMRATIVGGSDAFSNRESPNVQLARIMLEAEDVHIQSVDVGGNTTRRIILDPVKGSVTVHKRKGILGNGKDPSTHR